MLCFCCWKSAFHVFISCVPRVWHFCLVFHLIFDASTVHSYTWCIWINVHFPWVFIKISISIVASVSSCILQDCLQEWIQPICYDNVQTVYFHIHQNFIFHVSILLRARGRPMLMWSTHVYFDVSQLIQFSVHWHTAFFFHGGFVQDHTKSSQSCSRFTTFRVYFDSHIIFTSMCSRIYYMKDQLCIGQYVCCESVYISVTNWFRIYSHCPVVAIFSCQ